MNKCQLEINRFIYRLTTVYILWKNGHKKEVSVAYGSSNEHILFTIGIKMKFLLAKIIKWKRGKSTQKYTRNDEFSAQLFDAIYENNFELAKIIIDDGSVDVNIKNDCGDTPLLAVCRQTALQTEEEAVKFIHYLWQSGSKLKKSNDFGKTAMNYAESNGLTKIVQTLEYIQWKILYDNLEEACLL